MRRREGGGRRGGREEGRREEGRAHRCCVVELFEVRFHQISNTDGLCQSVMYQLFHTLGQSHDNHMTKVPQSHDQLMHTFQTSVMPSRWTSGAGGKATTMESTL